MALRTLWSPTLAVLSLLLLDGASRTRGARELTPASNAIAKTASTIRDAASFAKMPLQFEANAGQWSDDVHFVARQGSRVLVLSEQGATLSLNETSVTLRVAGGRSVKPVASNLFASKSNYFLGDDPSKHRTNVANYGTITYPQVRDGVDLVYRGEDGQIEYDFVVGAGVDVDSVAMNVDGAEGLSLTPDGDLLVQTAGGAMLQSRPRVFQRDAQGNEIDVKSRYRIVDGTSIGFVVAAYDRTRELVIDPTIGFAAFLAGTGAEQAWAVAVDADGNAYLAGQTASSSANFVTAGAAQTALGGGIDAFVAKINADNTRAYTTYLGGSATDVARGIAVDAAGSAFVTGYVANTGTFPTIVPAVKISPAVAEDAFVVKLTPAGDGLMYSTLYGGTGNDRGHAIALDAAGSAYLTGQTASNNGIATANVIGPTVTGTDAFVAKLNPAGSELVFGSYLGNNGTDIGWGIAIDSQNQPIVVGQTNGAGLFPTAAPFQACNSGYDGFVARFTATASALLNSSCYGGVLEDIIRGVALDAAGAVYVAGDTLSDNLDSALPYGGLRDQFVAKFDLANSSTEWVTYLGGDGNDYAGGIGVDALGRAHVAGYTASTNFPSLFSIGARSSSNDLTVTRLSDNGSILYSTLLGQANDERANAIAVSAAGTAYVAGQSGNTTTVGLQTPNTATTFGTRGNLDSVFVRLTTPGPVIAALPATVPPKGTAVVTLTGNGTLSSKLLTNASGGAYVAATGAYTAGAIGGVSDVIEGKDAEGGVRKYSIVVGPGVSIAPLNPAVTPQGTLDFDAAGGSSVGYVWSITTNVSGGAIDAATGEYTAGAASGADLIHVQDSLGNEASIQVAVGAGIAVSPAVPMTPPRGSIEFSAAGGSGVGFVWSLTANPSGGSITPEGLYVAGVLPNSTDTLRVVDSLANEAVVNIAVGAGVSITPNASNVTGGTAIAFAAAGGNGTYTWGSQALPSGGSIDAATGLYSAGISALTVTDIVNATDGLGNTATATVQVTGTTEVPDGGASSSSGSSSGGSTSSSGGASSSSSGNASSSSSSGAPSTSSSSSGSTYTPTPSGEGDDEGGGCSASPTPGTASGLGGLGFLLALVAVRRRNRAA